MKIFKFAAAMLASFACAGAAAAKCTLLKLVDLPITMVGLEPRAPAKINGQPVTFVLDSGAFYSSINPAKADQLHLTRHPLFLDLEGVAGQADVSKTWVKSFSLEGFEWKNVQFIVASDASTDDVVGLLGQNVLSIVDVEYDFSHGAVRLFVPADCGVESLAYWSGGRVVSSMPISTIDPDNPHTMGVAYINGARINVTFDTGATTSIISRSAAARAGVKLDGPGVTELGRVSGMGAATMRTWLAPVASFKIGDEEIRNAKIQIGELNDRLDTDMLLGADFFISHRIFVSNKQRRLYFTYEGGPVFSLKGQTLERQADNSLKPVEVKPSDDEPASADAYARRGASRQTQNDLDGALKDMTRAIELAPQEARYYKLRASLHLDRDRVDLAISDLDAALKLTPDDAPALAERGALKVGDNDAGAQIDLDAANRLTPKGSDLQLKLARAYTDVGRYDQAMAAYDNWLETHSDNALEGEVRDGRCWTQAQRGEDLDRALRDCNRAVKLAPNAGSPRESRGMVHLRRGENESAITDFNVALAIDPRLGWSFYGRGLAKLRLGKAEEAKADLAAGLANNPKLKELFLKRGIAKPGEL